MMIICKNCGVENSIISKDCSCCGASLGFPNVNECSRQEELKALDQRYREKIEIAEKVGQRNKLAEFEDAVKNSMAVFNVDLDFLHYFVVAKESIASNYQLQTEGEIRDYAVHEFDKERVGIEGTLFGSYGKNIRYAALSLDGSGLKSYGDFTIILSDEAVRLRATLLEENSYSFVKRHKILAGDKIPQGYRATWKERHKLAVAKLIEKILLTKRENHEKILLNDTGNRKKDDFIEVHIFGKINKRSIQAIRGNSKTDGEREKTKRIKDYLKSNNKEWHEE